MLWMLIDIVRWLAQAAWALCVFMGLLFLTQGTASDRPFAIGLLVGLAALAAAYLGPFSRWLDARRPGSEPDVEVRIDAAGADTDMPQVLAALGIPLDMGVGTATSALTGALAKTTVYRAHRLLLGGRLQEAIALLDALLDKPDLAPRVAGVAHYLRAGAYVQKGEKEPLLADIARARALYPGNPVIERAHQEVSAMVPPGGLGAEELCDGAPMGPATGSSRRRNPSGTGAEPSAGRPFYAPQLQGAREVRRHRLGDTHEAILRHHPPPEQQPGTIKILYSLALHATADGLPVLFVASELNRMYAPDREGSASHFLGVFPGQGHTNLGGSNDWADLDKFEARALDVARQHLAQT